MIFALLTKIVVFDVRVLIIKICIIGLRWLVRLFLGLKELNFKPV